MTWISTNFFLQSFSELGVLCNPAAPAWALLQSVFLWIPGWTAIEIPILSVVTFSELVE